ncbi:P1 family peptidase [Kordiimonas sp.]|uniref:P1 family peptidase n=1 Tax=Kordiimonas sp. TaxID=1970157 RepID=UPI003A931586
MRFSAIPGPSDQFTDVAGLKVGQAHDARAKTGVTVIIPDAPMAMAVDVRGGAPGTRDTEALDPSCLVEKVHGLVLAGGSVFGLAAADAVTLALSARGVGLPLGPKAVPVVPSAILFDLMNGGDKEWGDEPPYHRLAYAALDGLSASTEHGAVGAGHGAMAGAAAGGLGSASLTLEDGTTVSAIVAVNSFGAVPEGGISAPGDVEFPKLGLVGSNTTIGAAATNVALDKAALKRLAIMAHDGLARAIKPIHTPYDGDTIFAISNGERPTGGELAGTLALLGALAADCMELAVKKAVAR